MDLTQKLAGVRLLAMDVDGVLTDGAIGYDDRGAELKHFHVHDGLGLTLLKILGVSVAWISGRSSPVIERRGRELGITHLLPGVTDKGAALSALESSLGFQRDEVAYIGDDWNDLPAFAICGVKIAVANARREVLAEADFVTASCGGQGAVREVCERLMDAHGAREAVLRAYLASIRSGSDGTKQ